MKTPKRTSLKFIAASLAASFVLQACNTVDGLGEDVSAGADAMSASANENKGY